MKLEVMSKCCSLYKLDENREVPRAIYQSDFFSVTKTDKELSIICDCDVDISCGVREDNLRLIRVDGSLGFNTTGVVSSISESLSKGCISFFVISTFETDYIIIKSDVFNKSLEVLTKDGFEIIQ